MKAFGLVEDPRPQVLELLMMRDLFWTRPFPCFPPCNAEGLVVEGCCPGTVVCIETLWDPAWVSSGSPDAEIVLQDTQELSVAHVSMFVTFLLNIQAY